MKKRILGQLSLGQKKTYKGILRIPASSPKDIPEKEEYRNLCFLHAAIKTIIQKG
jgi:hypothetical protein